MGLFNFLLGKGEAPVSDPKRLWDELFAATRAADGKRLERLARANQAAILEHFPVWRKVPDEVRADPSAVQSYAHTLIGLAQIFAEKLGRPELMNLLTGTPENNSLLRWQELLRRTRAMMDGLRYDEARPLLTDTLIDARNMQGTGVERYLPITHGYLAECHFQTGGVEQALPHLEQALELGERSGDREGVVAYLGSLFEAHRYLGHSESAAGFAERLAGVSAGADAARWRTRARIVRAGEPLNRVVAVVNGVTQELDEVQPVENVRIQFVFERNRITLRPAAELTERGEKLGGAGRYEEALALFEDAARADPFDPHSRYQQAFTLLHLGRYADAADLYRRVEELAPGWFHCRADLWVAEQLALGQLDRVDFLALFLLQDGTDTADEKVKLARQLVARRPGLPAAHLHLGRNLARAGRKSDAESAQRAGLATDPDPDVRSRLLVELATLIENPDERKALYREAATINGNLVAAAGAALALRRG